jgi:hypothetical protein
MFSTANVPDSSTQVVSHLLEKKPAEPTALGGQKDIDSPEPKRAETTFGEHINLV